MKRMLPMEALEHPWLKGSGGSAESNSGDGSSMAIVQRIQRFGDFSKVRRSISVFSYLFFNTSPRCSCRGGSCRGACLAIERPAKSVP